MSEVHALKWAQGKKHKMAYLPLNQSPVKNFSDTPQYPVLTMPLQWRLKGKAVRGAHFCQQQHEGYLSKEGREDGCWKASGRIYQNRR